MYRKLSPLETAQQVLDRYRHHLRIALQQWLNESDTDTVLQNLVIDSGIYLSRNPQYARYEKSFRQFCIDEPLVEMLADNLFVDRNPYIHQIEAIRSLLRGNHTIIATGTGSGKTESFLVPILHYCLMGRTPGVKALLIYPMNALASDQIKRLEKYTRGTDITFGIYVGSTPRTADERELPTGTPNQLLYRDDMIRQPPDILITNYVMLDWMLTNPASRSIFEASSQTMRYIVLDEIHTYNGTKAAHIKYLLARLCHHFERQIVFAGTSATLMSKASAQQRLQSFVTNLFPIQPETYVPPITATEEVEHVTPKPVQQWDSTAFDEAAFATDEAAAQHLNLLTGYSCSVTDFFAPAGEIHQAGFYRALREDAFIDAVYERLRVCAASLDELADLLANYLSENVSLEERMRRVKVYLDAIAFVNTKAGEQGLPLLDYRIHLFLSDVGDNLKRCLNCGRFHVGIKERCTDCGADLFCVYRDDVRWSIAKINGQYYSPFLGADSADLSNVYYVLIAPVNAVTPDGNSGFRVQLGSDGSIVVAPDGQYWLYPLAVATSDQLEPHLIPLREARQDYAYLEHLLTSILQGSPPDLRKTLAFTDSRGQASRYSSILRDEYASRFLEAFLWSQYIDARDANIIKTLEFLEYRINQLELHTTDRAIFADLHAWYYRTLSIPERFGGVRNLLRVEGDYSALEAELLDVFVRERAIDKSWFAAPVDVPDESHFIYFQRYWTLIHHGFFFDGEASQLKQFSGVALSEQSQVYDELVKGRLPEIRAAVDSLVERNVLVKKQTDDNKTHYYLNAEYICFVQQPSPDTVEDYEQLRRDLLYVAHAHSSEVRATLRERIEHDFSRGEIQLVIATPTLEMGIDIGELQSVVMIGVPPSPANYAQRAGRAGRRKGLNALISTFCYGDRPHDMAAFGDPKSMINGEISPPQFNPHQAEVLKKHLNAYLMRNHVRDVQSLNKFRAHTSECRAQLPVLQAMFGDWFDYETYLNDDLPVVVGEILRVCSQANTNIRWYCYGSGIFPDYEFPRDEVLAVKQSELNQLGWNTINDAAITRRQPELALTYLAPGEVIYAAGSIYRVLNEGRYETLKDGARQYHVIAVEPEVWFASRHKDRSGYDIQRKIAPSTAWTDKGGVLAISYMPECTLSLRNCGLKTAKQESAPWVIGFDFKREALILRFDRAVCNDETMNSLTAALDRTIHEHFSLNPGEIRLMTHAQPAQAPDPFAYTVLYDAEGNNNLPFSRIEAEFDQLVQETYERLSTCSCEDGCYNCIKSYNLHFLTSTIRKQSALMFTGYLMGQSPFEPVIAPFIARRKVADLSLCVELRGNAVIIHTPHHSPWQFAVNDDQNTALYSSLTAVIDALHQPGMQSLHLYSPLHYVVEAVNKRQNRSGQEAFRRFQFSLLKFTHVQAFHQARCNQP